MKAFNRFAREIVMRKLQILMTMSFLIFAHELQCSEGKSVGAVQSTIKSTPLWTSKPVMHAGARTAAADGNRNQTNTYLNKYGISKAAYDRTMQNALVLPASKVASIANNEGTGLFTEHDDMPSSKMTFTQSSFSPGVYGKFSGINPTRSGKVAEPSLPASKQALLLTDGTPDSASAPDLTLPNSKNIATQPTFPIHLQGLPGNVNQYQLQAPVESKKVLSSPINSPQVASKQNQSQFADEYMRNDDPVQNDVSSPVAVAPVVNNPQQVKIEQPLLSEKKGLNKSEKTKGQQKVQFANTSVASEQNDIPSTIVLTSSESDTLQNFRAKYRSNRQYPRTITLEHLQGMESTKTVADYDKPMSEKYSAVAQVAPEIFTMYVLRKFTKINNTYTVISVHEVINSLDVNEKVDWIKPNSKDPKVIDVNLAKGLKFLNDLFDPNKPDNMLIAITSEQPDSNTMQYLQREYLNVPKTILATYAIIIKNDPAFNIEFPGWTPEINSENPIASVLIYFSPSNSLRSSQKMYATVEAIESMGKEIKKAPQGSLSAETTIKPAAQSLHSSIIVPLENYFNSRAVEKNQPGFQNTSIGNRPRPRRQLDLTKVNKDALSKNMPQGKEISDYVAAVDATFKNLPTPLQTLLAVDFVAAQSGPDNMGYAKQAAKLVGSVLLTPMPYDLNNTDYFNNRKSPEYLESLKSDWQVPKPGDRQVAFANLIAAVPYLNKDIYGPNKKINLNLEDSVKEQDFTSLLNVMIEKYPNSPDDLSQACVIEYLNGKNSANVQDFRNALNLQNMKKSLPMKKDSDGNLTEYVNGEEVTPFQKLYLTVNAIQDLTDAYQQDYGVDISQDLSNQLENDFSHKIRPKNLQPRLITTLGDQNVPTNYSVSTVTEDGLGYSDAQAKGQNAVGAQAVAAPLHDLYNIFGIKNEEELQEQPKASKMKNAVANAVGLFSEAAAQGIADTNEYAQLDTLDESQKNQATAKIVNLYTNDYKLFQTDWKLLVEKNTSKLKIKKNVVKTQEQKNVEALTGLMKDAAPEIIASEVKKIVQDVSLSENESIYKRVQEYDSKPSELSNQSLSPDTFDSQVDAKVKTSLKTIQNTVIALQGDDRLQISGNEDFVVDQNLENKATIVQKINEQIKLDRPIQQKAIKKIQADSKLLDDKLLIAFKKTLEAIKFDEISNTQQDIELLFNANAMTIVDKLIIHLKKLYENKPEYNDLVASLGGKKDISQVIDALDLKIKALAKLKTDLQQAIDATESLQIYKKSLQDFEEQVKKMAIEKNTKIIQKVKKEAVEQVAIDKNNKAQELHASKVANARKYIESNFNRQNANLTQDELSNLIEQINYQEVIVDLSLKSYSKFTKEEKQKIIKKINEDSTSFSLIKSTDNNIQLEGQKLLQFYKIVLEQLEFKQKALKLVDAERSDVTLQKADNSFCKTAVQKIVQDLSTKYPDLDIKQLLNEPNLKTIQNSIEKLSDDIENEMPQDPSEKIVRTSKEQEIITARYAIDILMAKEIVIADNFKKLENFVVLGHKLSKNQINITAIDTALQELQDKNLSEVLKDFNKNLNEPNQVENISKDNFRDLLHRLKNTATDKSKPTRAYKVSIAIQNATNRCISIISDPHSTPQQQEQAAYKFVDSVNSTLTQGGLVLGFLGGVLGGCAINPMCSGVVLMTLSNMQQTNTNENLSSDEKKKRHKEDLQDMFYDLALGTIANQTGADTTAIQSGDAQAIAMSAAANYVINAIDPNAQNNYVNPSSMLAMSKRQAERQLQDQNSNSQMNVSKPAISSRAYSSPDNSYTPSTSPSLYSSPRSPFAYDDYQY